ncbi:MAG: acyltransferase [Pseudomonadota bacterium]
MGQGYRIDDIQALRALAITMVVVWHYGKSQLGPQLIAPEISHWLGLGVGVDLFFVISGYVIARSLIPAIESNPSDAEKRRTVIAFWIRRAFRLFPSVWFWLVVILVCSAVFKTPQIWQSVETNAATALSVVFHFANYRFATNFMVAPMGAAFPYWSLSLEEQFYILLPLAILVLRTRNALLWFLVSTILLQCVIERGILGILFRSEGLAAGVLLALLQNRNGYRRAGEMIIRRKWLSLTIITTAALCLCSVSSAGIQASFGLSPSRSFNTASILSTILVFLASHDQNVFTRIGIIRRSAVWVGERSYAMYLCHIPALYLTTELARRSTVFDNATATHYAAVLGAVPLMLILSNWNYRYIEQPMIKRGRQYTQGYYRQSQNANI